VLTKLNPMMNFSKTIVGGLLALVLVLNGCNTSREKVDPAHKAKPLPIASSISQKASNLQSGLTSHFRQWLNSNGYGSYDFAQLSLPGGSYGGKQSNSDVVNNEPVIFIHGNSDKAFGSESGQTGWTNSISYFLQNGYTQSEVYAITWGPANANLAAQQYHSKPYIERIRAFIQAVKAYTGKSKVDVVSHSMGVTLCRKAIKGGSGSDLLNGGSYNLGGSLTNSIDTFVGIAGANWGLTNCISLSGTPTCGATNGFFPGSYATFFGPVGLSNILSDLNSSSGYEGRHVYSIWSSADQIVGYGCIVWGRNTCKVPGQDGQKSFSTLGHFGAKDNTAYYQLRMVKFHRTN